MFSSKHYLSLFLLTFHHLRWWTGINYTSAEMVIIGTALWTLHPALWSWDDLYRREGGRGGGALWLISWPGRTTTLPLARAYGAACPMDSCNRSTCPCSICVHVKEHRLVIPYYLLILYNTLGSFRKVATGLTLLPDWKGTNACIKILFFLYC